MRRIVIAGLSVAVIVQLSVPAAGDNIGPGSSGSADQGGASAGAGGGRQVSGGGSSSSGGGGSGGGGSSCEWIAAPDGSAAGGISPGGPFYNNPGLGGTFYDVYCAGTFTKTVFVPTGSPAAGPVVNPAQLAQQAKNSAPFKPLVIGMSPPSGREAVNFPIFLSLSGYASVTASASAAGVTSTVSIVPGSVTWQMGDGHSVTCPGPGTPYDPSRPLAAQLPPPCGYTYARSSANEPGQVFHVTLTVHFSASWTVTGAPGGGSLGTIDRSVSVPVTVGEVQVVNS